MAGTSNTEGHVDRICARGQRVSTEGALRKTFQQAVAMNCESVKDEDVSPSSPFIKSELFFFGYVADEQDVVNDAQNLQIKRPHALRDPPLQEVQEYNIAHMLLRVMVSILCSWTVKRQASSTTRSMRGRFVRGRVRLFLLGWRRAAGQGRSSPTRLRTV